MGHPIHRISSIARPVEPKYPTNLAILVLMGLALVGLSVTSLIRGAGMAEAVLGGLVGALVLFATWALGRDLAPDDDVAAFVALVPATIVVLGGVTPLLLGPLTALGLARVVNRSVGPPATTSDRMMVIVLVFFIARDGHGLGVGLAAGLAFALDSILPDRHPRGWLWTGLSLVAAVAGIVLYGSFETGVTTPGPWTWAAIATAGLLAIVIGLQPVPRSVRDTEPHAPLRRDRVQGGMVVVLVMLLPTLMGGDEAVRAWIVGWAACAGVVAMRPLSQRRGSAP